MGADELREASFPLWRTSKPPTFRPETRVGCRTAAKPGPEVGSEGVPDSEQMTRALADTTVWLQREVLHGCWGRRPAASAGSGVPPAG